MNAKDMQPKDRIIVALDVDNVDRGISLVEILAPHVGLFKIGLELITTMLVSLILAGNIKEAIVVLRKIRKLFRLLGEKIFWDGKFDDIPNTVGGAARAVAKLGVMMFNVHASASIKAMKAAVANKGHSLVLGVTVLTSIDDNDPEGNSNLIFGAPSKTKVLQFARDANYAGCDGAVCSPREIVPLMEYSESHDLLKVTPSIRSSDSPPDDQKRTLPAYEAIKAGADYLVIGRPITGAADPVAAAKKITKEIAAALKEMGA